MLGFEDESGISDKPVVRRTWAPKGQTPTIAASGSWKSLTMAGVLAFTPRGRRANLYLRLQPGAMGRHDSVRPLKDIKHELRGRKLLLIWDGLPAHTAKVVREYIAAQSSWPRVERYPGYAPELSPVEFLWSPLKTKDLAHLPPRGLDALKRRVRKAWCRIRKDKALLAGCLRKAGVLT